MSDSSDDDLVLLENVYLKMRKTAIHPINRERKRFGEYHHLFVKKIKFDEERFYTYTRMIQETFYYIFDLVKIRLMKNWANWHKQPILPEERLVVTIRHHARRRYLRLLYTLRQAESGRLMRVGSKGGSSFGAKGGHIAVLLSEHDFGTRCRVKFAGCSCESPRQYPSDQRCRAVSENRVGRPGARVCVQMTVSPSSIRVELEQKCGPRG
ncbi:hypothetical protein evm_009938 [Chilo suppressalis]|nr:hypothetical protein evm_009938 [Chilo suppressalis]